MFNMRLEVQFAMTKMSRTQGTRVTLALYFIMLVFIYIPFSTIAVTNRVISSDASTFTVSQRNSKSSSRRTGELYCFLFLGAVFTSNNNHG